MLPKLTYILFDNLTIKRKCVTKINKFNVSVYDWSTLDEKI